MSVPLPSPVPFLRWIIADLSVLSLSAARPPPPPQLSLSGAPMATRDGAVAATTVTCLSSAARCLLLQSTAGLLPPRAMFSV